MEAIARIVAEFSSLIDDHPHLVGLPTREILELLRGRLDERRPGWRTDAFLEMGPEADRIDVELAMPDGRAVRGALLQRPSAADV